MSIGDCSLCNTGKDKLADILNIHPSHAKELMDSFLGTLILTLYSPVYHLPPAGKFPGVQLFIQDTIATCRKQGGSVSSHYN